MKAVSILQGIDSIGIDIDGYESANNNSDWIGHTNVVSIGPSNFQGGEKKEEPKQEETKNKEEAKEEKKEGEPQKEDNKEEAMQEEPKKLGGRQQQMAPE